MCAATCLCTGVMQAWQGGRHNSSKKQNIFTLVLFDIKLKMFSGEKLW